jgi:hypothetical protein
MSSKFWWKVGLTLFLTALSCATSCSKKDEPQDDSPSLPAATAKPDTAKPDTAAKPETAADQPGKNPAPIAPTPGAPPGVASTEKYPWPPPHLLHFVGHTRQDTLNAIAVDDDYVYWWHEGRLMRLGVEGAGAPKELASCAECQDTELEADGQFVYAMKGGALVRFDRETGESTEAPLSSNHEGTGSLELGERYLYTTTKGCTMLSRYDRKTLKRAGKPIELEGPSDRTLPGRSTLLAATGRLFCAAPTTKLHVIDTWEGKPRVLAPEAKYMGLAVLDEDLYWTSVVTSQRTHLGHVPIAGGEPRTIDTPKYSGRSVLAIPQQKRLLVSSPYGFETFDAGSQRFMGRVPAGRPAMYVGGRDAIYATTLRGLWLAKDNRSQTGHYIAKVPLSEFAKLK